MQEFSSTSVSTYDPDSLTGLLNDHAADGWTVVAIVPTGSTVTAYLSREATGDSSEASEAAAPIAADPPAEVDEESAPESAPAAHVEPDPAPAPEPVVDIAPAPAADPVLPTADPSPQPATSAAAPAGWYADPSGRYELRYWDGGTWTEHVSRAGQQYTDPPVA
jgi:hypothetical protein